MKRKSSRPSLRPLDRLVWVLLFRLLPAWREALVIVKPETVIAWHRKGFRLFWTWKSRRRIGGRPPVPREVRELIRRMSRENPLWGAPVVRQIANRYRPGIVRPVEAPFLWSVARSRRRDIANSAEEPLIEVRPMRRNSPDQLNGRDCRRYGISCIGEIYHPLTRAPELIRQTRRAG